MPEGVVGDGGEGIESEAAVGFNLDAQRVDGQLHEGEVDDGIAAVGRDKGVGEQVEEAVEGGGTDGNVLSVPKEAAAVAEGIGGKIVVGSGEECEVKGVDGVACRGIMYSLLWTHGVAVVPKAVEPEKRIAAGEVLVGRCPCVGSDDGEGGGVGALASCEFGDETHGVGARMLVSVDGIVLGRDVSIAEVP